MSRPTRTLAQLPPEILDLILQHVKDVKDVRSCCCVSRLFNDVAERVLYRIVNISSHDKAKRFALALRLRPGRRNHVHNVSIDSSRTGNSFASPPFSWTSMMLCPLLIDCPNLEKLNLASHYCYQEHITSFIYLKVDDVLYHQLDLFDMLRRASLRTPPAERIHTKLTTLRLYFRMLTGWPEWALGSDLLHMFLSPTLREISLHGCDLTTNTAIPDALHYAAFQKSTPLEVLRLRHSFASVEVLHKILSIPRRLKCFLLEIDNELVDPKTPSPFSDLESWTRLFAQHKDSLEEIVLLVNEDTLDQSDGCLDLRGMERMRLLVGSVLWNGKKNTKWPPGTTTMRSPEYYKMLDETRPEWAQWIEHQDDMEEDGWDAQSDDDTYSDLDPDLEEYWDEYGEDLL
ncbi:uncharacterized protein LTHEOB_12980 [Lasiodiplodia theobromae]|uniref:uncharacterized protein n=1 Tax=Lasiodiplodia theobromae TaxID=45133 RepID=UPI0015C3E8C7|nr:uncharacterized protein LTHEOB_12980 [Lasiodiplodia theobromae]KAF4534203.1 hypothetical protein LTHEOB_12980 [Lasiodiplodia theobromae]